MAFFLALAALDHLLVAAPSVHRWYEHGPGSGPPALVRCPPGGHCGHMRRVAQLRGQLADGRGGQVVFLSHCLLNQNVRYLGGAGRTGGVREVVDGYLGRGVGICQLPCPEQRAWGGVLKRRMLVAYGSAGTLRAPMARLLLRPFTWYTRRVYARLARAVVRRCDHLGSARDCR